jgi:hypothetical protein
LAYDFFKSYFLSLLLLFKQIKEYRKMSNFKVFKNKTSLNGSKKIADTSFCNLTNTHSPSLHENNLEKHPSL